MHDKNENEKVAIQAVWHSAIPDKNLYPKTDFLR